VQVTYFGTWEDGYPRNEQVISALRKAGVHVDVVHESLWSGEHKFATGVGALPRLVAAEARLALRRVSRESDALIVGYPGHSDIWSAKRHGRPVVFNAMVSLYDTLVEDRGRFSAGSLPARALRAIDRAALRAADSVVSDTKANAAFLADLAGIEEPAVCYVGAEERLFTHGWRRPERFTALFVGKLIPLHGIEVILDAAARLPHISFRVVGSGQLETLLEKRPSNVEHVKWIDYNELPSEYARAGCALGVFGASAKARRVIPNKAFQAMAVGTPLVTAATEGVAELLEDRRNAVLTSDSTGEALAQAIQTLHDDAGLSERIGRAGRKTFEIEASEHVLGGRWRDVVETATRRTSASSADARDRRSGQ
jgi:glycosyltransferase involved in cell wall biosynthesis